MENPPTIQLKDFCRVLNFDERPVRYILEQGHVPKGTTERPKTGNRREFGPAQAFWLAIAVHLRAGGLKTEAAVAIAERAVEAVRIVTQNFSWDPGFYPIYGWFDTEFEYYLEVADLEFVRLRTSACPSKEQMESFGWIVGTTGKTVELKAPPLVVLQLNLSQIAAALSRVPGWKRPESSPNLPRSKSSQ